MTGPYIPPQNTGNSGDLAFDARAGYAMIVVEHMNLVSKAMIDRNYPQAFDRLRDLFNIAFMKLNDETIKEYHQLVEVVAQHSKKYDTAWSGGNDEDGREAIYNALSRLQQHLLKAMDKANIFGGRKIQEKWI